MTKKNNNNFRLKVTTACQNCQRRKIKCSGEIPCRYCSKVDKKCEPGKPGKKRGPPPGQEVIRSRNSRMESVYNNKDPQVQEELRNLNYDKNTSFSGASSTSNSSNSYQSNLYPVMGYSSNSGYPNVDYRSSAPHQSISSDNYLSVKTRREDGEFSSNSSYITELSEGSRLLNTKMSQHDIELDCAMYLIDMSKGDKGNGKNDQNSSSNQPNKREHPPSINKQKQKQFRHIEPKLSNLPIGKSKEYQEYRQGEYTFSLKI
ncbi:hypothetical protein C1645_151247 [Glomus cerebriforme]|uniref:Zn(2)-C6 fungal-type domain-containing protein n=1 Tax=Glomus cerebriforme TaxID=658196 RepID=A0A397SWE6_9GLOM|nr:hypothetical protein C1645_151247 [Glomus cerebriforme]